MSKLLSPRAGAPVIRDVGERSALVGGQRVGRARRRHSRRRAHLRIAVVAVVAVTLGTSGGASGARWLLTSPRFRVATIDVRGANRISGERVVQVAGLVPGTNVFRVDPRAVVARVEAMPEIRRAELIRELPNRLTLVIEERRPFTLVHGDRLHWLDEDGHVIGDARQAVATSVPVIGGLTEDEIASMASGPTPRVRDALALIRTLLRNGSRLVADISEIDVGHGDGPVLYTMDGVEIRLGSDDWTDRLARLEGVLAQIAGQDSRVSVVDLRFRDQVVLTRGG